MEQKGGTGNTLCRSEYSLSVCAYCEHGKMKNKQDTSFHIGVWLHLSIKKVNFENEVELSKSKMAALLHAYKGPTIKG